MSANATMLETMFAQNALEVDALEADSPQANSQPASETTRHYHQRTKHTFQAYAKGPDTLDWDAQPAPFRHFSGTETVALPSYTSLQNPALLEALQQPFVSPLPPTHRLPLTFETLSALLQLSFGITAWKTYGPDRWAVRANPSSGNLHPTEVYVFVQNMEGLKDGLYHYRAEDHTLERRADLIRFNTATNETLESTTPKKSSLALPQLHVAFSSVMWREAWKYGERAFRYCQLDTGHAIGALSYAAQVLGWDVLHQQVDSASLNTLLGLNRLSDFPHKRLATTELEEAECLMRIQLAPSTHQVSNNKSTKRSNAKIQALATAQWAGKASTIDAHPMYQWPVIGDVAAATRCNAPHSTPKAALPTQTNPRLRESTPSLPQTAASQLILQRRSAQRFNPQYTMPSNTFMQLLQALLPSNQAPWNALSSPPLINLVFWVHRVEGLLPGLYALMRAPRLAAPFNAALAPHFTRELIYTLDDHAQLHAPAKEVQFMRLHAIDTGTLHRLTRSLHCHQDIASNACFAVGMLTEFDAPIAHDASYYRDMHHEAGLIGQVLYLHAELHGVRGTGIGCFFDDPVHEVLGLTDAHFQSIYHFTVGQPMEDTRISTVFTCASQPDTHAVKHADSASTNSNLTPLSTLST